MLTAFPPTFIEMEVLNVQGTEILKLCEYVSID
jgi:hypothetical protein